MKYTLYLVMVLSLCGCAGKIGLPHGQTIDEYIKAANGEMLWGNCVSVGMKPVENIKDTNSVLKSAFENRIYDEGRPEVKDCLILEARYGTIHCQNYYLIRFVWKNKERILLIDTTLTKGRWTIR